MQQEGVASVLLPHPAFHLRAHVPPCGQAPLGESAVLSAAAARARACVCVCVRMCVWLRHVYAACGRGGGQKCRWVS